MIGLAHPVRPGRPEVDLLAVQVMAPASWMFSFGMQTVHDIDGQLVVRFMPTSTMHPLSFEDPFSNMLLHHLIRSFRFDFAST